jgi:hypothetical protein
MPMSARLLRPRASGVHPEAASWRTRVVANGGSVSTTTMQAVDRFCRSIDAAGIRDRFYRLSLFAGTSLNAALVPLYRGQSLGGTQFGNATDTNANFVSGDYVETGASGGLQGNGSSKSLNTGLAPSAMPGTSRHLSFYANTVASADFTTYLGCREGGAQSGQWFLAWRAGSAALNLYALGTNSTFDLGSVANHTAAFYLATNDTSAGYYYRNGTSADTTDTGRTPLAGSTRNVTVFALNFESGVGTQANARMSGYSIGEYMTAAQSLAFYNAMQTFQTALSRNV